MLLFFITLGIICIFVAVIASINNEEFQGDIVRTPIWMIGNVLIILLVCYFCSHIKKDLVKIKSVNESYQQGYNEGLKANLDSIIHQKTK